MPQGFGFPENNETESAKNFQQRESGWRRGVERKGRNEGERVMGRKERTQNYNTESDTLENNNC